MFNCQHINSFKASSSKDNKTFFQPKLTINQPNDIYEREADAMADKVMRMSDASINNTFFKPAITLVQRKCAHCEEEANQVQRKENSNENLEASQQTENYINNLSGGNPLGEKEKKFFEAGMGYDFSNVRLHTDSNASKSAKSINALAYTSGNNIVFNQENYSPETNKGKRLLAHELTHVIQQQQLHQSIQRERELNADESKDCFKKIDDVIKALETSVADANKNYPDYIKEAVKVLREKRDGGKIKCYAFEGIKHGRVDFSKDEIQYDGIDTSWINETAVLHEAVHALHGKKYSVAAKQYGKALDEKKGVDTSTKTGIDILKFKAWTEYWAYRSSQEYYNDNKKTEEEIHSSVMKIHEVMIAITEVRKYDGGFDVRKWKP